MKKIIPVIITIILIIIVAAAGMMTYLIKKNTPSDERMDGGTYFKMSDDAQVAVMIDGTISEIFGIKDGDRYYVEYETVVKHINKRFYWDENENKVLYALPNEVREIAIDDESRNCVSGDGVLYFSMELLAQYTDMSYEIFEAPERVVIQSGGTSKTVTTTTADTAVRYRGGIKSEILTDAPTGTLLHILDTSFANWTKVATLDGYIGYVENESLDEQSEMSNPVTSDLPEYTSISRPYKINMVWHQTTSQIANDAVGTLLQGVEGVNVIAPTWFIINDTQGNLINLSSASYVAMAHERGMEVWAVLNDFDGGIASNDATLQVLSNTAARRQIINTVMESVLACGINGVNVDIEKVSEACAPHYLQFLRELSVSCRNNGIVLSVDNYVPKEYSAYFDRKEQGIVADYLVIMGYDEHFAGSEKAGSVASLPFVEEGIQRTLQEVPAEKVINGIPFYTRIWNTDSSGRVTSEACGMNAADAFVQSMGISVAWNETCAQNYGELDTDAGFYQIWLEDEQSVAAKMDLIKNYNLAGVAAWKLGFERPSIWQVIREYL